MASLYPANVRRRTGVLLGALFLVTATSSPLRGFDDPKGPKKSLPQAGFSSPDLDVKPSLEVSRPGQGAKAAGPQTPELPGVGPFLADSSPDWEVTWDARSDRPHLIQGAGYPLLPGAANRLAAAEVALAPGRKVDRADVERLARQFLGRHPDLFRVDPDTLRLDPSRSAPAGNGRVWFIELQQFYEGIPVEGANLFFRINNGNIVQLGSERLAPVQVKMVPRSRREPAFTALLKRLGIAPAQVTHVLDAGTLKIYPVSPPGELAGQPFRGARGAGYRHRLAWQFSFRRVNDNATYKAVVDANTGELLQLLDLTRYAEVKGGVYPRTNTDPEVVVNFPFASVSNGGPKTTDATGSYVYGGGTATASLTGRFTAIADSCGQSSLSNGADGTLNFGTSSGTDCTTPGFGGAGNTHASRTAFFHLTSINRKASAFLPGNPWLEGTLTANVNLAQTCNAFWDGSTVNLFASGGGCSNTGELAGIIAHEWGHGLDENTGGAAEENASGEAVGDTFAFIETRDSCIGRNFRPGANCYNCSDCTGVRDPADFALGGSGTIARPSTITDDAGINCDRFACPFVSTSAYMGPMGYQGHCESLIASGANWDLAQLLVSTHGTEQGWAAMDALWYDSLVPSKSAYQVVSGGQCNPAAVVNGCGPTNWYTIYLTVDDDDGNLANGTPNGCRIWDAFDAHGIACGTRPVCTGGCAPQAVANAGPDRAVVLGGSVTIGTPAQAGTTYSWSPGGETTAQITVSPAVTTTYTVTATTGCGSSTDTVTVTVQAGSTAVWDAGFKAPTCGVAGSFCESGATLLLGRDGKGPEPNQPNTIGGSCSDGTAGTFHTDESIDTLRIETTDGGELAPGKTVLVTAGVWAYSTFSSDRLDLYYAADASAPTWTLIATLTPTGAGARTLTATYVLPSGGPRQAIRANFRYNGSASPCSTGTYDDHDDLVFAVKTTPDTIKPLTSVTAPSSGATVGGTTTVSASASDNVGVSRVEFWIDGALLATDTTAPYGVPWDTTAASNGSHSIVSRAYDAADNMGVSATVAVTVFNAPAAPTAVYDATLKAPRCALVSNVCDAGPVLLLGRDGRGPEPNQPNTLGSTCADGTAGTFHVDESLDALRVETTDGSELAPGKTVLVTASVWAYSSYSSDWLDLYYAADATAPTWTRIATLSPPGAGARTLTATFTLPTGGSLQAIRGNFRYGGSASSCSSGTYDDRDDLVFPVKTAPDTTNPTTAITAPANGATVGGTVTVTASASDNVGVTRVEFWVDGVLSATDTSAPYSFDWNTSVLAAGAHALMSRAYDAMNNAGSSPVITVTVDNSVAPVTATYDASFSAPRCATFALSCDSGPALLAGRDGRGPEPNQPNTINASCADGTAGTYHVDESVDRLKVSTLDGTALTAGKTVRVEATVWAWTTPSDDRLDLYYAPNAASPTWTLLATLAPTVGGTQTLSATYVLPAGAVQAVRAQFRYQGTAGTCTTGTYNDRDDLVFAVR